MKKEITLGEETRRKLLAGSQNLIQTVRAAVGPGGRTVLAAGYTGAPEICGKARDAANKLSFRDVTENAGAILLRRAGGETAAAAGDGSGIAMLLAGRIVSEGSRFLSAGYSPVFLRQGIEKSVPAAVDALRKLSLNAPPPQYLARVASLAAQDECLGRLVCEALDKVNYTGEISIKASDTGKSYVCSDASFSVPAGYQSKYMVNREVTQEVLFEDAAVLVCASAIKSVQDILPLLNECSVRKQPLLVIADAIDPAVVKSFVSNIAQGTIQICSVEAPGVGAGKLAWLEDAAIRTGTVVFGTPLHPELRSATLHDCGRAGRARISRDRTALYDGKAEPALLSAHLRHLDSLLALEHNALEDERLHQRIANLSGRTAELRIGAVTEAERSYLTQQAEGAVKAARLSARDGVLPGGGAAYLRAIPAVKAFRAGLTGEEQIGAQILIAALEEPARVIAANAGFAPSVVAARVSEGEGFFGFDAAAGQYGDLAKAGILDSTAVLITALETAASVGAQLLTAEAAVLIDGVPVSALPVPDDLHITPQDFM